MIDSTMLTIIISSVVGLIGSLIGVLSHVKRCKSCCCSCNKEDKEQEENNNNDITIEIDIIQSNYQVSDV